MKKLFLLVCLLPFAPLALAEDEPTYYHMEMIVFTQPHGYSQETFENGTESTLQGLTGGPYGYKAASNKYLNDTAKKLRNSGNHTVLVHTSWRQAGVPQRKSPIVPINIHGGVTIEGAVRVHRKRYLFLETDLNVFDGEQFRIQQIRKMRSKELHYIDHPRVGILVIAYPIEQDGA